MIRNNRASQAQHCPIRQPLFPHPPDLQCAGAHQHSATSPTHGCSYCFLIVCHTQASGISSPYRSVKTLEVNVWVLRPRILQFREYFLRGGWIPLWGSCHPSQFPFQFVKFMGMCFLAISHVSLLPKLFQRLCKSSFHEVTLSQSTYITEGSQRRWLVRIFFSLKNEAFFWPTFFGASSHGLKEIVCDEQAEF